MWGYAAATLGLPDIPVYGYVYDAVAKINSERDVPIPNAVVTVLGVDIPTSRGGWFSVKVPRGVIGPGEIGVAVSARAPGYSGSTRIVKYGESVSSTDFWLYPVNRYS